MKHLTLFLPEWSFNNRFNFCCDSRASHQWFFGNTNPNLDVTLFMKLKSCSQLYVAYWQALTSCVGGVIVSVLAIGLKVHGFKPGRGDGFFRAIKIRNTPSFGRKVKPEAPRLNIFTIYKITVRVWKKYFVYKIHFLLLLDPSDLLLGGSAGKIGTERFGGRIGSFPQSTSFHHGSPCSYSMWEWTIGPLVVAGQRCSLAPSTWWWSSRTDDIRENVFSYTRQLLFIRLSDTNMYTACTKHWHPLA
jgi:hypothetical protein